MAHDPAVSALVLQHKDSGFIFHAAPTSGKKISGKVDSAIKNEHLDLSSEVVKGGRSVVLGTLHPSSTVKLNYSSTNLLCPTTSPDVIKWAPLLLLYVYLTNIQVMTEIKCLTCISTKSVASGTQMSNPET